jgi:hypothetical protein
MNALFEISLYRIGKTWFFDDKDREIIREPFVAGASEIIQKYLNKKGLGRRRKNISIIFSTTWIPNWDIHLVCTEKCGKTSAYYKDQEEDVCWLCPAQIKFFGQIADEIYATINNK